jgi:hypothetical protein
MDQARGRLDPGFPPTGFYLELITRTVLATQALMPPSPIGAQPQEEATTRRLGSF